MTSAKRQRLSVPAVERGALVLGFGLLLGLFGPFGTYPTLARPVRYAFWVGLVAAGFAAALAARHLVSSSRFATLDPRVRAALVAALSALPMTFLVDWVMTLVQPGRVIDAARLPGLYAAVAAVQLLIVVALLRELRAAEPSPAPAEDARPAFPEALLARLPRRLGCEIVALEAEDHYLRVHTRLGADLILMRLSDAAGSIDPRLGLQVHRSWWVAHDAVAELVRTDQRLLIQLDTGLKVPIGRTYASAVRAATRPARRGA